MLGKNIEHNRIDIDGNLYSIPQFYINHVTVLDREIAQSDRFISKLRKQNDNLQDKLHRRNMQIKDLKTQLDNIKVIIDDTGFTNCVDTVKANGKSINYTVEYMD